MIHVSHGMAEVAPGVRLHALDVGKGARAVLLLHGFPQTSHEWRKIVPPFVDAGLRVVAPDYRGAGASSKPASGYDKPTMAGDVRALVREHLGVSGPIAIVGHDIGAMVALAYALRFRDEVSHLVLVDSLFPGTAGFERMRGDPRGWHAAFHSARDVAEMLVQGRERAYLQHMISVRIFNPAAIAADDFDVYVRAYEAPGAMRAGFELYRTFDEDGHALKSAVAQAGKLATPTLAVGGMTTGLGPPMAEMLREAIDAVETVVVPGTGHWIPEENPAFLAEKILGFIGS